MTTVAFFGHDAADAAVRRRVQSFRDDGVDVTGFMMRRRDDVRPDWDNVDLGLTHDGAFLQRILRVVTGARQAAQARDKLGRAEVIYARNLDMLACAFLARRRARLATPVIYESLDVHRLLTRQDMIGRAMRWLERSLLRQTIALVVSSPGFLKNHFEPHYAGLYREFLVENRLAAGATLGPRPMSAIAERPVRNSDGPLRLGWVGNLRCQRSLDLLCALAERFPDSLEIHLHGQPARTEIPVFEPLIEARKNMSYGGRYRSPEDLADIYGGLDLVWSGDFMEAGANSVWLLPNRIYEGGYYATPSIAPAGTETAAWIERHGVGFVIAEPLQDSLPALIVTLLADRSAIAGKARALMGLDEATFIQPRGFMAQIIKAALDRARRG